MADTIDITPGAGESVSSDAITTLNGSVVTSRKVQRIIPALKTAAATAVDIIGGSGAITPGTQRITLATDDPGVVALAAILAKLSSDPATQTTLAAILAKIISTPATEAKQDLLITANHTDLVAILSKLTNDPATQTTLAAILAKLISTPATEAKQDTGNTSLASILAKLSADPATQTTLAAILAKLIAAPSTEAKQDNAITQETAINTVLGIISGAGVTTDANGTIQQYLRGLIILWLAGLKASSAIIGKVGIDQTTSGTTNLVSTISGQNGVAGGAGASSTTTQRIVLATDTTVPNVTGNIAHDGIDSGNPIKIGGKASSPDALPTAVSALDRVDAAYDLSGRFICYLATALDLANDTVRAISPAVIIRPTITISATPDYSIGDTVGAIITLPSVMESSGRSAHLRSVTLKENSGQAPALTLLFFRSTPSGGTYTDNSALAWGTGDSANLIGVVRILAGDWYTVASKSQVSIGAIDQLHGSVTSDLYLLIIADSVYNAAATTDLTGEFGYERR